MLGKQSDFLKARPVDQLVNALSGSELTRRMLLVDSLFSATTFNPAPFFAETLDLFANRALGRSRYLGCHSDAAFPG
jgi:hypothetical protein